MLCAMIGTGALLTIVFGGQRGVAALRTGHGLAVTPLCSSGVM